MPRELVSSATLARTLRHLNMGLYLNLNESVWKMEATTIFCTSNKHTNVWVIWGSLTGIVYTSTMFIRYKEKTT